MKAKHVELVVAIADAGSLGAAADRLNRSQPALTKALKIAEQDIGCLLFDRGTHGMMPTVTGQRVVERCRIILRELELLDDDVSQVGGDFAGTLNLVVSPFAAMKIMPPVLRRYCRLYPGVRVQVTSGVAPGALRMLRSGAADVVIGPTPDPASEPGLLSTHLLSTGICIVTGATSCHLGETTPRALADAAWAMIGPRDRRPLYSDFFEEHDLTPPVPGVCSDSILTILSMIDGSDLLCSLPTLLLPEVAGRWQIVCLDLPMRFPDIPIALVIAQGRMPTPAAQAFAAIVLEESEAMRNLAIA